MKDEMRYVLVLALCTAIFFLSTPIMQAENTTDQDNSQATGSDKAANEKDAVNKDATSQATPTPKGVENLPENREQPWDMSVELVEHPAMLKSVSSVITLNAYNSTRTIYYIIGKLADINVIFDPECCSQWISLQLNRASFLDALAMVASKSSTFWMPVNSDTIFVTAAASFQKALTLSPKNPEAVLMLAQLEQAQGKNTEAEAHYRQVLDLSNGEQKASAMAGLARMLTTQGKLADCEQLLKQYLSVVSADQQPAIAALLGDILLKEDKLDEAKPLLEEVHQASPAHAAVIRTLANVYAARKDYLRAASLYSELITSGGQDTTLHYDYGKVLLQLHRFAEAQDQFLTAFKLNPKDGQPYTELAMCANENKGYILVLRALQERAQFLPETPGTLFLRATAFDYLKDYPHATDNYRLFLAASNGKYPDQEWQARHRLQAIENMQ